jgi:hypothetical protein
MQADFPRWRGHWIWLPEEEGAPQELEAGKHELSLQTKDETQ